MSDDLTRHVEKLIEKAAGTEKAAEALKFSQGAANAANALCSLLVYRKETSEARP